MRRTALVFALLVFVVACTSAPATETPTTPAASGGEATPSAGSALAERAAEAAPLPETVPQAVPEAALAQPAADPLAAAAQAEPVFSCDNEGAIGSTSDVGPAELSIVNATQNTYQVFELDENGQRQERAQLPPGDDFNASTFETHAWLIARDDRCIGIVSAPAEITIEPTTEPGPQPSGGPLFGPTPTAVASGEDPATLLSAAMLTATELPAGLASTASDELTDSDPAYADNGGRGILAARWDNAGTSDVVAVMDLRALFESPEGATAYLEARESVLSEQANGMQLLDGGGASLGDNASVWHGQSQTESGVILDHWIYLFTSGPFVAKVYVAHAAGVDESVPDGIAAAAAARTAAAWGGTGEDEPFPSEAERELLSHVPSAIAATCQRTNEQADGAVASVGCPLSGGPAWVFYVQFDSKPAMDAYFEQSAQSNADATGTDCESGPSRSTWSIDGTPYGQVLCNDAGGFAYIEWTDDRMNISAFAYHEELDYADLYEFWATEAGPNP